MLMKAVVPSRNRFKNIYGHPQIAELIYLWQHGLEGCLQMHVRVANGIPGSRFPLLSS